MVRAALVLLLCLVGIGIMSGCTVGPKETTFYVSRDGSETGTGTLTDPFATLEQARDAVRALKTTEGLPDGDIMIYIHEGVYPLLRTFVLSEEDSGTESCTITWSAYPKEQVSLIGGKVIGGFETVTDANILQRFYPECRNKILQTDLKTQGITDYGTLKKIGFGRPNQPVPMELFFKGEPMTLAEYPNNDWLLIDHVPQSGDKLVNEGSDRTVRFGIPVGRHYGRFAYDPELKRPDTWSDENDIWVHGYWTQDWAESYERVTKIDTTKHEIYTEEPHGVYGYTQNQKFRFVNVLEELDRPGEWYVDRTSGIIYFWPPEEIGEGDVSVSILEEDMLTMDDVSYVTVQNITFEFSRGNGIIVRNGTHNRIAGCTVRNIGNNAVSISGGTENGAVSCDIYGVGGSGISISGGDRQTLTPAGNYALNNHIHHYSRINRTYRPAVSIHGVGNRMAHNYMHDGPHMGVSFSGNENILEFNEIHDIALETGDVGAFYIGRNWTTRGNVVRHNFFHHLHGPGLHGVMAVYLDDASSGTTIYGNIFYEAGRAAFIGGGRDNTVENNIFVDCPASVHIDARGIGWASRYIVKGGGWRMYDKLAEVNYTEPPYSTKYPKLATILDKGDQDKPMGNIVRRNISFGGKWLNTSSDLDLNWVTFEDNMIDEDPGFVDPEHLNFQIRDDSPAYEKIGFERIPVEEIGLYIDQWRTTLPERAKRD